jgi:hypothetical protein
VTQHRRIQLPNTYMLTEQGKNVKRGHSCQRSTKIVVAMYLLHRFVLFPLVRRKDLK